jgi:hypothetical protein
MPTPREGQMLPCRIDAVKYEWLHMAAMPNPA